MTTDLESRLRADLSRLADHLIDADADADADAATRGEHAGHGEAAAPGADPDAINGSGPDGHRAPVVTVDPLAPPPPTGEGRTGSRWVWSAAAAAVLIVLIGAIAVFATRADRPNELGSGDVLTESTTTVSTVPTEPAFVAGEQVSITVSIFSGRQDPVFVPTAEEQAQLVAVLNGLPPASELQPEPPQLGFRGFVIAGLRPSGSPEGQYRIDVWEQVSVSGYDPADFSTLPSLQLDDPDGELFDLLLAMVDAHRSELAPGHDETWPDLLGDRGPRSTASTTTTIGYDRMPALVTNPGPEDAVTLRGGSPTQTGTLGEVTLALPQPNDLSGTTDPRLVWTAVNGGGARDPAEHRILLLRLTDTSTGTNGPGGAVGESRDRRVWVVARLAGNAPLSTIPNPDVTGRNDVPYELFFFDAETGEGINGLIVTDGVVRESADPAQPDGQR